MDLFSNVCCLNLSCAIVISCSAAQIYIYNNIYLPLHKRYAILVREEFGGIPPYRALGHRHKAYLEEAPLTIDEQLDVIPYEFLEMFIDGFKLRAKIMAEVFRCG